MQATMAPSQDVLSGLKIIPSPFQVQTINKIQWPPQGQWTYEDYQRLPDDTNRYEIIQGVLYVASAPRFRHQYVVQILLRLLGSYIEEHDMEIVIPAPFEVHLSAVSRPVQPDLFFIQHGNQSLGDDTEFRGVPDMVIEVLSPSTWRTDRTAKFAAYELAGVQEYWIVDPQTRAVEVHVLTNGFYQLYTQTMGDDELNSPLFPDVAIQVSRLFPQN